MSKKQLTENQIKQIIREEFAEKGVILTEEEVNELFGFGEKGKLIKKIQQLAKEYPEAMDKLGYEASALKGLSLDSLRQIEGDLEGAGPMSAAAAERGDVAPAGEAAAIKSFEAGKEGEGAGAIPGASAEKEKKTGFSKVFKADFIKTLNMRLAQDKQFAAVKAKFPSLPGQIWINVEREIQLAKPELAGVLEEFIARTGMAPAGGGHMGFAGGRPSRVTRQTEKERWEEARANKNVIGLSAKKLFKGLPPKAMEPHLQALINAVGWTLNDTAGGRGYFVVHPAAPSSQQATALAMKIMSYDDLLDFTKVAPEAAPGAPAQPGLAAALGDAPEASALDADLAAQTAEDPAAAVQAAVGAGEAAQAERGALGAAPTEPLRSVGLGGTKATPARRRRRRGGPPPMSGTRIKPRSDRSARDVRGARRENQEASKEGTLLNEQKELELLNEQKELKRWKKLANISDEKD